MARFDREEPTGNVEGDVVRLRKQLLKSQHAVDELAGQPPCCLYREHLRSIGSGSRIGFDFR
eukprot:SAG11_NODE_13_length_26388_cov_67.360341_8_plen_62_part_00